MKSPYTGKEMKRVFEKRIWKFRGEEFEYFHTAWQCEDTGEQFTTDESDTAGYFQVTNQYREKYGIPYTDEIISARERYNVSAAKMALILGLGINQYRLYEQGEVPSVSNGRLIRSIMNPRVMLDMVDSCQNELSQQDYKKIYAKVRCAIAENPDDSIAQYETQRIFSTQRGAGNGFAQTSLIRLKNILLNIIERCDDVWCTKMNKLLFYTDFLSYRERGFAMTGLSYKAIAFGPVPERWERVYTEFSEITLEQRQACDYSGSVLHATIPAENGKLSDEDLKMIEQVCNLFGQKTSNEISLISHNETAWQNHQATSNRIPFTEAFSLKAL